MKKLKLYIWKGFCPDWSNGLAFAIAKDEAEAKELIEEDRGYEAYEWGSVEILPLDKVGRSVSGGGG